MSALLVRLRWHRDEPIMFGAFGKSLARRWLLLLGLNPGGEDALANTRCLILLYPNEREGVLVKPL